MRRHADTTTATAPRPARPRTVALAGALVLAALAIAGLAPGRAAAADGPGKAVFGELCQGCHTIGGGKKVGPDLAGIAKSRDRAWVEQFILHPDKVIASGDPVAKELVATYGMAMPNLGVTQPQADALLAYLGFAAAPETTTTPTTTTPEPTTPAPAAGDASRGKRLFEGTAGFHADSPSCLSCHSVAGVGSLGGGQVGPDLTGAFAKYGGQQGLSSALGSLTSAAPSFPTMAPIFGREPLTATEISDLVAFLKTAPDKSRASGAAGKLVGMSLGAAALLGAIVLLVWGRRVTGIRKPLVKRSREARQS